MVEEPTEGHAVAQCLGGSILYHRTVCHRVAERYAYLNEIDAVAFYRLDYVKDAVVYLDRQSGQLTVQVLFEDEADTSSFEADLKAINRSLPPYMRVQKTIIRTEEFEKTSTKKIKRFAI